MKNKLLKYCMFSFVLLFNIAVFAQPASGNDTNDLEGADPPAPIDMYVWVLVIIGLFYALIKLKTYQKKLLQK